jgi:hypothetical protein
MQDEMLPPKPWWLSRGIVGPVIAATAMGAQAVGVDADVSTLLNGALDFLMVAGIALGWWGRVEAKAPIDMSKIFPGISLH